MKEKDGYVNYPEQQVILYVEKEDGKYEPMQTGSYISGNYLGDYEEKRYRLEESLRNSVLKGEISLVKYYMVLEDLTVSELAARVGLSKGKVSKHLNPVHFGKMKVEILKKYAEVFNIPLSGMLQIIMLQKSDKLESYTILEEKKQTGGIDQQNTANPFVVMVKIGEKTG
jgi:antitoxin component HigA of HigAB toxin-antitoxin module